MQQLEYPYITCEFKKVRPLSKTVCSIYVHTPCNSNPSYYPRNIHQKTCARMFTAALLNDKHLEQTECPPRRMCYLRTTEFYRVIKINNWCRQQHTWTSQLCWAEKITKDSHCIISLYEAQKWAKRNQLYHELRIVVSAGGGTREKMRSWAGQEHFWIFS